MPRLLIFASSLLVVSACAGAQALTVESPDGEALAEFCVRVASTEAERRTGLRGAPPLETGEGLLLAFPIEDEVCIVNDGVSFAIDVAFADRTGVISAIERAVPAGDGTARCHPETQRVLETGEGGLAVAAVGDRLR